MAVIYKIVPELAWQEAREEGIFHGASIDLADGYIHFSTAAQAKETAARYFAGQTDLLLVAVDSEVLGDALKFEPSRGGDLFPHLYGLLSTTSVLWATPLPLDKDGAHQFPEMLP
ncbi:MULTISPECIES: DUF952 domain-containing protein [Rhizobium]|uniref:DUF952 domain-containing protein n=1 Tax=Rhizobium rhododendri TaxID=2506430 RepID=A0ABY8II15_9HYPH|nr:MULTISPECIES: DUF952 domain-containing protein [Rhizobium]MBO9097198.1 DUF952 domain-containing protein [Rhizobium sp. L58/93]MBO9133951.1 DUF952 domain-containing protein [Rhizobium sp. B209b/85]MBO9167436.1 DUF952 domain-containing protein [Rhizobium sp. L245/93]MBO9183395.1 DUF952 domain-containing protein [Rhizobium sp. E27B/91]MBZ5760307.1 DUF952 domain-containing protein [Rhizobium sp. VS19-DR96]